MRAVTVAGSILVLGAAFLSGCGGGEVRELSCRSERRVVPSDCSLRAWRGGRALVLEIALRDIPKSAGILAIGLKLHDGRVMRPDAIDVLPRPSAEPRVAPKVTFRLDRPAARPRGGADGHLCLQIRYELPEGPNAGERSVFTLALGEPDSQFSRRRGITTCLSSRDGSPFLVDPQVSLETPGGADNAPLLSAAGAPVPSVSFRLTTARAGPAGAVLPMRPVVESLSPAQSGLPVAAMAPPAR